MRKKTKIAMTVATGLLMACGVQKNSNAATESETTAAQQLFSRMDTLRQQGYMFGHQDDPMYGLTWAYDKDSSDVKNTCGDYPAVMGFELGHPVTIQHWNKILLFEVFYHLHLSFANYIYDFFLLPNIYDVFLLPVDVVQGHNIKMGLMLGLYEWDLLFA